MSENPRSTFLVLQKAGLDSCWYYIYDWTGGGDYKKIERRGQETQMYKLIAFDAYGTLFDVYSIGQLAEKLFAVDGQAFASMWRDRQIDYTRLVTMSDPNPKGSQYYLSFWDLTNRSLRYVCKRLNLDLSAEKEQLLLEQYSKLTSFEDAASVLKAIKDSKISTCILSNGNKDMLTTVVGSNGLTDFLDKILTIEDVKLFKTSPQAYELLLKEFSFAREEILFVSSNAWDALAAKWYGFDVFWVNRYGHPFEEIGLAPDYQGRQLSELLPVIRTLR
jgi:2-haloacid dehalogenase